MNHLSASRPVMATKIPLFLAPAFADRNISLSLVRSFTSTTCNNARSRGRNRDRNRRRGVSAMRSTGPRKLLSVDSLYPELPVPRPQAERPLDNFPINPDHGLYGFFNKDRKVVLKDEEESQHGRCWEYKELMFKSFEELHQLFWTCVLERNIIATRYGEFKRLKLGHGGLENQERAEQVTQTMKNIRHVLRDRQLAYEEAHLIWKRSTLSEFEELTQRKEQPVEEDAYRDTNEDDYSSTITPESSAGEDVGTRKRVIGPRPTN